MKDIIKNHIDKRGIIFLVLSFMLVTLFENLKVELTYFVYPTGKLTSFFCGGFSSFSEEGFRLLIAEVPVLISTACSGLTFFCILFSFITISRISIYKKISLLLLCYPLTIIANMFRIISSAHTHQLIGSHLPGGLFHTVHLVTGVIVYLTFFIFISLFIQRKLLDANR
jgi:exosortase K